MRGIFRPLAQSTRIDNNTRSIVLCKNCSHYMPSFLSGQKYGRCRKFGTLDLVDGTINYDYASIARKYSCKGEYYQLAPPK